MFVRPCWRPKSDADARSMLDQHPWALLVSNGADGPMATNLPLMVDPKNGSGDTLVLVGHLARANEHLQQLRVQTVPVLAVFEGPWSYVTASWYPKRQMPSTYYYTAVHCYGTLSFQDDVELGASLEDLTRRMESQFPDGWSLDEIPQSEIARRLPAIQGFRMTVSKLEAKFKLGQDEHITDALAVADVLDAHTAPSDRALAALIRQQNAERSLFPRPSEASLSDFNEH